MICLLSRCDDDAGGSSDKERFARYVCELVGVPGGMCLDGIGNDGDSPGFIGSCRKHVTMSWRREKVVGCARGLEK